MEHNLERKPCGASRTIMTQLVFPQDTNHHGTMFGGKLMEYIDKTAASPRRATAWTS